MGMGRVSAIYGRGGARPIRPAGRLHFDATDSPTVAVLIGLRAGRPQVAIVG